MQKTGKNLLPQGFGAVVCLLFEMFAAHNWRRACGNIMPAAGAAVIIIICACLSAPPAFAVVYTFTGSGDWTAAQNWSPSYPGTEINDGNTVEINGDCDVSDLTRVRPGAVMNINSGGTINIINNSGDLSVAGAININDGGTVNINYGRLFTLYLLNINDGGVINVEEGTFINYVGNVNVNDGGTLNINPNGQYYNVVGGSLNNYSTINNYGIIEYGSDGGTLNNYSGATLNNYLFIGILPTEGDSSFSVLNNNGGTLNSYDKSTITNQYTLNNNTGGTINLYDSSILATYVPIASNDPAVLNNNGGAINIHDSARLDNYATMNLNGGLVSVNGAGSFTVSAEAALNRTANGGHVVGKLTKVFGTGGFTFHVGTMNGYSPVTLSNIAGSGRFTVRANEGAYAGAATGLPANRLARWWQLDNQGLTQADLTFQYLPTDITAGTEANYKIYRISGGAAVSAPTTLNTVNHTATATGVSQFSPWTLAELAPTAASVGVAGKIMTSAGAGLNKARVVLTDSSGNSRTVVSNPFGFYRFDEVRAGEVYILTVFSKGFRFLPLVVNVNEDVENLNLTAQP